MAEKLRPMIIDVPNTLHVLRKEGKNIMFEGAQGTLLDIDHGTYPYVTSSSTSAGGASTGSGVGPQNLDYILGITKAYTTRVGSGPFTTELFDDIGKHIAEVGQEIGASLCVTKMDVLDELETIKICVAYELDGVQMEVPPINTPEFARCTPVYEEMPGWQSKTFGITKYEDLPEKAKAYLARMSELLETPIDIISTGPDRDHTMIVRNPYEV
ncbi:Adenylosuccinate synthetase [Nymphon striatum]|nr:Adenylosuccinate synthetase [Nymphon striatum]